MIPGPGEPGPRHDVVITVVGVGLPSTVDPCAVGQVLADAVTACTPPLTAAVARLVQHPDDEATTGRRLAEHVGAGAPVPAHVTLYIAALQVPTQPRRPPDREVIAAAENTMRIALAVDQAHPCVQALPVPAADHDPVIHQAIEPLWRTRAV